MERTGCGTSTSLLPSSLVCALFVGEFEFGSCKKDLHDWLIDCYASILAGLNGEDGDNFEKL